MEIVLTSAVVLGVIGALAALVLYVVSKRFAVYEDERIGLVEELLPGANCGACGCSGCHDFAVKCVGQGGLCGLCCPGAGAENMAKIAALLGGDAEKTVAQVAVLKCNGACESRRRVADYAGPRTCRVINRVGAGELSCSFGCLGCGDCVGACRFGVLSIDPVSKLPVVDEDKCTGCGLCASTCPRRLIEIRAKGPKSRRVWVACSSKSPGAVARKECDAACIGCGKCVKACPFEAISVSDNVAHIDASKCRLCRKCVAACPVGAIHTVNFPAPVTTDDKAEVK